MTKKTIEDVKRENLKRILSNKGIKDVVFAQMIGVKPPYVSAMLKGKRNMGETLLPRICDALGISQIDLIAHSQNDGLLPLILVPLCEKVRTIMESKTIYVGALAQNIDAFHEAVNATQKAEEDKMKFERKILELQEKTEDMEKIMREMQKRDSADHLTATGPPSQLRKKRGTSSSG